MDTMNVAEPSSPNDREPSEMKIEKKAEEGTSQNSTTQPSSDSNPAISGSEESKSSASLDMDSLYSIFWSLQDFFSQPTRLFRSESLETFKSGLQMTMNKFKEVQQEQLARGTGKLSVESKRGIKRKRAGQEGQLVNSFNPKYLTSRDLFDLEVNDLSFRRHMLVQALILLDFLLSLTPRAKRKLEHATNKSVLYAYTLNEDDAKWASGARTDIASYLQQGPEGKFYYRMVDTVLSRDKNWVQWKAESCPEIARAPVTAEDFAEAEKGAQMACAPKRLRPNVLGALNLNFLTGNKEKDPMLIFKDPARFKPPSLESFRGPIAEDQFDIEMAKDEESRRLASERRASKLWRVLRIASKGKLGSFDQIEDGKNLDVLFEPEATVSRETVETNGVEANADLAGKNDIQMAGPLETTDEISQIAGPEVVVTS